MIQRQNDKQFSSCTQQRKTYIAPCITVEPLIEEANFLAASGPEAGVLNPKLGNDLTSEIDDN